MEVPPQPIMHKDSKLPEGLSSITVEKHKHNFQLQHGTFEDKPQQNISKWLQKASKYQDAHMIPSLEMAAVVGFSIKGEPLTKIRRMLEIPGTKYKNADHFDEQPEQKVQVYKPYQPSEDLPAGQLIREDEAHLGVVGTAHPKAGSATQAVPQQLPMRFQPKVEKEKCLKAYLLDIYKKKVNLEEATKFLNTFRKQNNKQTCSNFLDQFVILYDRYTYMRWTDDEIALNKDTRDKEMIQLAFDGICKEFKTHVDNTKILIDTLDKLEDEALSWQRNTTTGKAFTAECNVSVPHAKVSTVNTTENTLDDLKSLDLQTNSQHIAAAAVGRQSRGASRGNSRGRGRGRGRGAIGSAAIQRLQKPISQSRDTQDGGHHNYRQSQDGTLHQTSQGHPMCNYCGKPSHKREACFMKLQDRKEGNNRVFHPDRDTNTTKFMVRSAAAVARAQPAAPTQELTSVASVNPIGLNSQYQWAPWNQSPWNANQVLYPPVFPQQQVAMANTPMYHNKGEQDQFAMSGTINQKPNTGVNGTQNHMTSAAVMEKPEQCPFTTCNATIIPGQHAQEHYRTFHQLPTIQGSIP